MNNFFQKYKDPRWQKKRLEVLEFNGFVCQECGNDKNELHVHHAFYLKDRSPWEYELEELKCLCGNCHKDWHDADKHLKDAINSVKSNYNYTSGNLWFISGFIDAFKHDGPFDFTCHNLWHIAGACLYLEIDPDEMMSVITSEGTIKESDFYNFCKGKKKWQESEL